MAAKVFALFLVAVFVAQGYALTEITLADQYHTFITNPLFGKAISIPKSFLDSLESCHVIMSNGQIVEVFPNNNLNVNGIVFLEAAQPFVSCGIAFMNVGVSLSGAYELMSLVQHSDSSRSLTRQRFHMTFILSEVEFPLK